MRVLILGSASQLGRALLETRPEDVEVLAYDRSMLDITDPDAVASRFEEALPDIVFNAAGYTDVDGAESDCERATAVNTSAVGYLADSARASGSYLIHVSTDFVFDGRAGMPYPPDAEPNPLGVYGRTKLAGERLAGPDALVVRTAWLYAPGGHNFVGTMLRLMRERDEVRVVADQVGSPTCASSLAAALWEMSRKRLKGVHHFTDAGVASRYDFAVAIMEEALAAGLLDKPVSVVPIATSETRNVAARPAFSVLDKTSTYEALGRPSAHWRVNLRSSMRRLCLESGLS